MNRIGIARRCFVVFLWVGGVALNRSSMRPTDDRQIPVFFLNFKYWLTCLWRTFLPEHEVNNKIIAFSAVCSVHGLSTASRWTPINSEPVSLSF